MKTKPFNHPRIAAIFGAIGAFLFLHDTLAADLLLNGSFELPDIGANNRIIGTPASWVGVNRPRIMNGSFDVPEVPGPQDGQQYVSIGNDGAQATISQTFTNAVTGTYELTWFDSSGVHPDDSLYSVTVFGAGGIIASKTLNASHHVQGWLPQSMQLNLVSGAYTLAFSSLQPGVGGLSALIDNVSIPGPDALQIEFSHIPAEPISPSVRPRSGYPLLNAVVTPILASATVTDGSGNPKPGISVIISVSGNNILAGHDGPHVPSNVHGWIFEANGQTLIDDDGVQITGELAGSVSATSLGGSARDIQLTLTADQNGQVNFVYIPAEVSGVDTLDAKASDQGQTASTNTYVTVLMPSLVPLTAFTSLFPFSLFGVTATHSQNWFASPNTVGGLRAVAQLYVELQFNDADLQDDINHLESLGYDFPNDIPNGSFRGGQIILSRDPEVLFINDVSLPWGGLFDAPDPTLPGNFAPPHGYHRDGSHVDLKSVHLVGINPYTASQGVIRRLAAPPSAVEDGRLRNAQFPFRNTDFYFAPNGRRTYYNDHIRSRMNRAVQRVHYIRFLLLIQALQSAGCYFITEGDHIHVRFP